MELTLFKDEADVINRHANCQDVPCNMLFVILVTYIGCQIEMGWGAKVLPKLINFDFYPFCDDLNPKLAGQVQVKLADHDLFAVPTSLYLVTSLEVWSLDLLFKRHAANRTINY